MIKVLHEIVEFILILDVQATSKARKHDCKVASCIWGPLLIVQKEEDWVKLSDSNKHENFLFPEQWNLKIVKAVELESVSNHDLLLKVVFLLILGLVHGVVEIIQLVLAILVVPNQVQTTVIFRPANLEPAIVLIIAIALLFIVMDFYFNIVSLV